MLMVLLEVASSPTVIDMLEKYGPAGAGLAVVFAIMMRLNKNAQERIENLEKGQQAQYKQHLQDHREMNTEYAELVRSNTQVISNLTSCLKAFKDTLERIERKSS